MAIVNFNYKGIKTTVQCNIDDSFDKIIQKFSLKCTDISSDDLYFIYNGKMLDLNLSFLEAANEIDKERKVMDVLVNEKLDEENNVNSKMKKSKYIICPQCKENINISIKDFTINLEDCKNGHKEKNIFFDEFEKTQFIDQSKIICDQCKKIKKSETFENRFFICYSCNKFLCPLCKNEHNKEHHLIDYEQKDFICNKHYESYTSYCNKCKNDICVLCLKEHNGHEIINYGDIIPDVNILEEDLNKLKKIINDYKKSMNEIIAKIKKVVDNLDNYYNIYNNMIKNFDIKKRNYNLIVNIIYMNKYNDDFMDALNEIARNKNMKKKLNDIFLMYCKMTYKEDSFDNDELNEEKKEVIENFRNKSTLSFMIEDDYINLLLALNDERILICSNKNICLYNLNNNDVIVNDICAELKYKPIDIKQMDDNNLIELNNNQLRVIKINKYSLDEIQSVHLPKEYKKIIKITKEKICISCDEYMILYEYNDNKLTEIKEFQLPIKNYFSMDRCCPINEKEIAIIYILDGKIYGLNSFLIFYDIEKFKEIKTLKLGDGYGSKDICFINENYIVASVWNGLRIINIKDKKISKEIKTDLCYAKLFQLNINLVCCYDDFKLYVYYFKDKNDYNEYSKNELINDEIKLCKFSFNKKFVIIKKSKKVIIYKNYYDLFNIH